MPDDLVLSNASDIDLLAYNDLPGDLVLKARE